MTVTMTSLMYSVSQKKNQQHFFVNNFAKCWSIFKILSPLDSAKNTPNDVLQL